MLIDERIEERDRDRFLIKRKNAEQNEDDIFRDIHDISDKSHDAVYYSEIHVLIENVKHVSNETDKVRDNAYNCLQAYYTTKRPLCQ